MQSIVCAGCLASVAPQHSGRRTKLQICRAAPVWPSEKNFDASRRALLTATTTTLGMFLLGNPDASTAAGSGQAAPVGEYLPPAGIDDFVEFIPDPKKTPAIRAGTVDPSNPYKFALPPTWREARVANILSGNYCQPRCDEPWTEVIFENPDEGRAALLASPLFKLTPKKVTNIAEIGTPEGVIFSVGPYITGTFLDEEDVMSSSEKKLEDGQVYYYYEVNSPFAKFGQHIVTSAATKGEVALLFVVSATEKQWTRSEGKIRKMVDTFRV